MKNLNATWNDFSTQTFQREVSFQVSSDFLTDEGQTKAQMATLGQEKKNLWSELQEHRVNAVESNPRTVDQNQKRKTNFNMILRLLPPKRTYPKLVLQEDTRQRSEKGHVYSGLQQKTRIDHGSEQWLRGQDIQRRDQNYTNDGPTRTFTTAYQKFSPRPNFAYGVNDLNNRRSYDQCPNQSINRSDGNRSPSGSSNNHNENWRNNTSFSHSPRTQRRDSSQNISYCQPRSNQPNNSAFGRSDNQPTTGFTPYEQKILQNSNQTSSNIVRFIGTDTINELSDLCSLNY